ncbi:hypothetical protein EVAR_83244_1 [Eumeta japonica]|uniref:Uncharacterized protein n=1 Tax=Eumeta variegata TaxID=151549 RepID=A0A4C1Y1Y7_EUMVA|nr:hypothetical protein EVAR_83244_1 [Eumeta japonica]
MKVPHDWCWSPFENSVKNYKSSAYKIYEIIVYDTGTRSKSGQIKKNLPGYTCFMPQGQHGASFKEILPVLMSFINGGGHGPVAAHARVDDRPATVTARTTRRYVRAAPNALTVATINQVSSINQPFDDHTHCYRLNERYIITMYLTDNNDSPVYLVPVKMPSSYKSATN